MERRGLSKFIIVVGLLTAGGITLFMVSLMTPRTRGVVDFDRSVLQPATYKDAKGRYSLFINPKVRDGSGEGEYEFKDGEKVVWSATLPFTLAEACVSGSGNVAGYGYLRHSTGNRRNDSEDFVYAILDSAGKILFEKRIARTHSNYLHFPPNPRANGVFIHETNDRAVFRIDDEDVNRNHEEWLIHELSSGKSLGRLDPKWKFKNSDNMRHIMGVRPIEETPLILVHWWLLEGTVGGRFALIDMKGKPVWTLDRPKDMSGTDDDIQLMQRRKKYLWNGGGIPPNQQPLHFDILFVEDSQRVSFEVLKGTSEDWSVKEVGRVPHELFPADPYALTQSPVHKLTPAGILNLQTQQEEGESKATDIWQLELIEGGRIGFLQLHKNEPGKLCLIDSEGKRIAETSLPEDGEPNSISRKICGVGGDTFLVTSSPYGEGMKSKAWLVTASSGEVKPLEGFECGFVDQLVGFSDGGFCALVGHSNVEGFDRTGKRIWALEQDYGSQAESAVFSPSSIARTTDDKILVLDVIRHTVQVFNREGKYERRFDLEKAWGRKPNYPSVISADIEGGFIVEDFDSERPTTYYRMTKDGKVTAEIRLTYADGTVYSSREGLSADAKGDLWGYDGFCLARFQPNGIAEPVLGKDPSGKILERISGIEIDEEGKIYAVDNRTGSVHVFKPSGEFSHACELEPKEIGNDFFDPVVTVNEAGELVMRLGDGLGLSFQPPNYAQFSKEGKRLGTVRISGERSCFQPKTGNLISMTSEKVEIKTKEGELIRKIDRKPDGNWFVRIGRMAIGSEGEIAIFSSNGLREDGDYSLSLFNAQGDPLREVQLPIPSSEFPRVSYRGERIIICFGNRLVIYDVAIEVLEMLENPLGDRQGLFSLPYLNKSGDEVLIWDADSSEKALRRFKIE